MKKEKVDLFLIIAAPIAIIVGVLMIVISDSNSIAALGGLAICLGVWFILLWLIRFLASKSANKEKRKEDMKRENQINDALYTFKNADDNIELNTVKFIKSGMEFYAEGRYVCEKDFKGIPGHHLAFEIKNKDLKRMPKDCDDVCDIESNGFLISVGYQDNVALEEYANDNGVILQDAPEKSIGQTITLHQNKGYFFNIWTAEGDDIDYGFIKILKCEKDVLTIRFFLDVSFGLCDKIEGVVELKKDEIAVI